MQSIACFDSDIKNDNIGECLEAPFDRYDACIQASANQINTHWLKNIWRFYLFILFGGCKFHMWIELSPPSGKIKITMSWMNGGVKHWSSFRHLLKANSFRIVIRIWTLVILKYWLIDCLFFLVPSNRLLDLSLMG